MEKSLSCRTKHLKPHLTERVPRMMPREKQKHDADLDNRAFMG